MVIFCLVDFWSVYVLNVFKALFRSYFQIQVNPIFVFSLMYVNTKNAFCSKNAKTEAVLDIYNIFLTIESNLNILISALSVLNQSLILALFTVLCNVQSARIKSFAVQLQRT